MTGGQVTLDLANAAAATRAVRGNGAARRTGPRPALPVLRAGAEELEAHERRLDAVEAASGGHCVWRRLTP
jgi:DNA polymerase-3 subunit epsilon